MITKKTVNWANLMPDEFMERQSECPIVLLPVGLCEPHGHISVLGLDLIKAQYYCEEAAKTFGGIVAPSQGYHIHETGFHAAWLDEVVGQNNAMMTSIPPLIFCHLFIYQLRAFVNAGFHAVIVVSGHSGGSQEDLRLVASSFENRFNIQVIVKSDPEWLNDDIKGDHAGKYEISQLIAINEGLVDLSRINRKQDPNSGGRLALGEDANESSNEYGSEINRLIISMIGKKIITLNNNFDETKLLPNISLQDTETLWQDILRNLDNWNSHKKWPKQKAISDTSKWKSSEILPWKIL